MSLFLDCREVPQSPVSLGLDYQLVAQLLALDQLLVVVDAFVKQAVVAFSCHYLEKLLGLLLTAFLHLLYLHHIFVGGGVILHLVLSPHDCLLLFAE